MSAGWVVPLSRLGVSALGTHSRKGRGKARFFQSCRFRELYLKSGKKVLVELGVVEYETAALFAQQFAFQYYLFERTISKCSLELRAVEAERLLRPLIQLLSANLRNFVDNEACKIVAGGLGVVVFCHA